MAFADNFEAWFNGLKLDAIGPTVTLAATTEKRLGHLTEGYKLYTRNY